ncbi:hypothetical protein LSTR_LSTR000576 [Laodelphax striatellus]|uniref:Centrosomin N-terminal motif 1 domain-containing protein n=1 Tax=Laodelphax striatellus TaxID=195883 RepID=A0A482XFZ0_LAOST|nr:hypothetical protein LSTR_LSTR000576 [Laodelphax striatellus]
MDGESSVCSTASSDKTRLSPGRIRTMKEYEEQMAELKKENFNLKLRIYFIEERQEQLKGVKDIEELFNKNLELSCELDSLRKDLSEKEELLIQSARAVEILQVDHQDKIEQIRTELEREKSYLQDHIDNLQRALKEKDRRLNQLDNNSPLHRNAFGCSRESIVEQDSLRTELSNITNKYVKLEEELEAEKENYLRLQEKLECSTRENVSLEAQVRTLQTELEKRQAHLKQAYIDLERKGGFPPSPNNSQQDEQLTKKEEEMAELVKMINEIERNFETSVTSKQSNHSLSRSSSSNNSLSVSCKDQPATSPSSILRNIFFRSK